MPINLNHHVSINTRRIQTYFFVLQNKVGLYEIMNIVYLSIIFNNRENNLFVEIEIR